jgi:simple sugar transport system permease protein
MDKESSTSQPKRNFFSIFYEELSKSSITIIILSIISGFIMGGILVIVSSPEVYKAFGSSFVEGLSASWKIVANTYSSLFIGAFGDPAKITAAIETGEKKQILSALGPFFESLVVSTPYLFTGVAVALGFRAGAGWFHCGCMGWMDFLRPFSVDSCPLSPPLRCHCRWSLGFCPWLAKGENRRA